MTNPLTEPDLPSPDRPDDAEVLDRAHAGRVQCPNCCKLAYVTRRSAGLLFYRCELCLTVGAAPDPAAAD
jgi:hypothetical protein